MNDAHDSVDGLREVCHDIRQPIAAVLALAGAALTTNPPEDMRQLLAQIVGLAEWQSDVIESWLEASARSSHPGGGHTDVARIVSDATAAERLTWAGNLTLVGSVANLIVAERARTAGVHISFGTYCRAGIPLTLVTLLIGAWWLEHIAI